MIMSHLKITDRTVALFTSETKIRRQNCIDFHELIRSYGVSPFFFYRRKIRQISSKSYFPEQMVLEIEKVLQSSKPTLLIVSVDLKARHHRYLEEKWCCKILDRTELILRIFEMRALSSVGKLQVEIALVAYQLSKLVRTWTHLERQKGGIGLRGGPGEKQIEIDRRLLRVKKKRIEQRIDKAKKTRMVNMKKRIDRHVLNVALVGYTNAGKSTLFNRLTGKEDAASQDLLFMTLDPLTRKLASGTEKRQISLTDTVGFIEDMPESLMEAFHATLVELLSADLILHVVDLSDELYYKKRDSVLSALEKMGANAIPRWTIFNKIDLNESVGSIPDLLGKSDQFYVSSKSSLGINRLKNAIVSFN